MGRSSSAEDLHTTHGDADRGLPGHDGLHRFVPEQRGEGDNGALQIGPRCGRDPSCKQDECEEQSGVDVDPCAQRKGSRETGYQQE